MNQEKLTTFTISERSGKKLRELSKKYNTSHKAYLELIIEFFHRTGHDPENLKIEGSAEAIKILDKRLISFIRQQEKDILLPMRNSFELLNQAFFIFKKEAPKSGDLQQIVKNQKVLNEKFDKILNSGNESSQ